MNEVQEGEGEKDTDMVLKSLSLANSLRTERDLGWGLESVYLLRPYTPTV
jgi:hypothetical protein